MPPKKKKKKKPKKDEIDLIALEQQKKKQQLNVDIPPYQLVNVVSTCSLGVDNIDLRKLALEKNFLEFNPLTFAAATFRIRSPRTTCLLFASGNMVITGSSNNMNQDWLHENIVRCYRSVDFVSCSKHLVFKTLWLAPTLDLLSIYKILRMNSPYASYDPDLFPGLVFRSVQPKLVFLIFRSGKIVITGAKKMKRLR